MSRHVTRGLKVPSVPALAAAAGLLSLNAPTGAAQIGNDLIAREFNSDGSTQVLQVYRTDPVPGPGVIKSFSTFNQDGNTGGTFNGYVLRPTPIPEQYTVIFDSGPRTLGNGVGQMGVPNTFQHTPVAVQAGDLIAHYRNGIPFHQQGNAGGPGEDPLPIYFPSPNAPTQGSNITLGSSDYPNAPFTRTYSFAADFRPAGDPAVGNDLGIRRFFGSDGAENVLNVYHNSPAPEAGSLDTVSVRYQTGTQETSADRSFQFLVLRPAAGGQYDVVYNSGTITQPSAAADDSVQTYALPDANGADAGSVSVQAGDLVAHYGRGIPFTIVNGAADNGAGTDNIYFPSNLVPSGTITLGGGEFPLLAQERDYALSANFTAIPEPAGLALLALGGAALLGRRRAR